MIFEVSLGSAIIAWVIFKILLAREKSKKAAAERLANQEATQTVESRQEEARLRDEAWKKSPNNPKFRLEQKYEAYLEANARYYKAAESRSPELAELKIARDKAYRSWKELHDIPSYIPTPLESNND